MGIANSLRQTFTPDGDLTVNGESINSLDTDTIKPDRLLEGLRINLPPSVHLARSINELTERDTTPVVTHSHLTVTDSDLDLLTSTHDILVDRVVKDFLQQDIDTVIGMGAISKLPDIHPWTATNMLVPLQGLDVTVVVVYCRLF